MAPKKVQRTDIPPPEAYNAQGQRQNMSQFVREHIVKDPAGANVMVMTNWYLPIQAHKAVLRKSTKLREQLEQYPATPIIYLVEFDLELALLCFLYTGQIRDGCFSVNVKPSAYIDVWRMGEKYGVPGLSEYAGGWLIQDGDLNRYGVAHLIDILYGTACPEGDDPAYQQLRDSMLSWRAEYVLAMCNAKGPKYLEDRCKEHPQFGMDMIRWLAEARKSTLQAYLATFIQSLSRSV